MSFNLRIPAGMDVLARLKAGQVGISLNALVLIALDAYLKSDAMPSIADLDPPKASRTGTVKVAKTHPGEPKVSSPPTKKELAALHNWRHEQAQKAGQRELVDGKPSASDWRGPGFRQTAGKRAEHGIDSWLAP